MSAASRPSSATRHKNRFLQLQEPHTSPSLRRASSFRKRRRLLIVKVGGFSLSNPKIINLAVASVALENARGNHVVVVFSAVGNTTDQLLQLTNGEAVPVDTDKDDIFVI